MNPPEPPSEHKLNTVWDAGNPPGHGEVLTYNCSAGGAHNRLKSDYTKNTYTLTCLKDNQFSAPTWPTCVDSKLSVQYCSEFDFTLYSSVLPEPLGLQY